MGKFFLTGKKIETICWYVVPYSTAHFSLVAASVLHVKNFWSSLIPNASIQYLLQHTSMKWLIHHLCSSPCSKFSQGLRTKANIPMNGQSQIHPVSNGLY